MDSNNIIKNKSFKGLATIASVLFFASVLGAGYISYLYYKNRNDLKNSSTKITTLESKNKSLQEELESRQSELTKTTEEIKSLQQKTLQLNGLDISLTKNDYALQQEVIYLYSESNSSAYMSTKKELSATNCSGGSNDQLYLVKIYKVSKSDISSNQTILKDYDTESSLVAEKLDTNNCRISPVDSRNSQNELINWLESNIN